VTNDAENGDDPSASGTTIETASGGDASASGTTIEAANDR
jgi:hypothetical protein